MSRAPGEHDQSQVLPQVPVPNREWIAFELGSVPFLYAASTSSPLELAMRIGNQPPSTNLTRDERKNGSSKLSRIAVIPSPTQAGRRQTRTTASPKAIDVISMVPVTAKP